MRRLGHDLLANLVAMIRDTKEHAVYMPNGLRFGGENGRPLIYAKLDGDVVIGGLWSNPIPFDWNQRRSIRRAVAWRHRQVRDELIRLGEQAKRQQQQATK